MPLIGEIKLFPYDDVLQGYLQCKGQSLKINHYPKLYMMIGTKFGQEDDQHFSIPNLTNMITDGMQYCIAFDGDIPKL